MAIGTLDDVFMREKGFSNPLNLKASAELIEWVPIIIPE